MKSELPNSQVGFLHI